MKTNFDANHLAGKICLVTGATAGIGKITASALAAQGAHVVIAGRNQAKTEATAQQIIAETGNPAVDFLLADFADLHAVCDLASTFLQRYQRLNVLVNNAGTFYNQRHRTALGVEKTFLVNHLAPFLLTNMLLDVLKRSAPARIINVSSDAYKSGPQHFNDLEFNRFYFGIRAYGRSKLANILFTNELDRRLAGSGVTVNALHPGHVATDIWSTNFSIFGPPLKKFMSRIALTPEAGADNTIYLASSPDVENVSGKYFKKRTAVKTTAITQDREITQCLWAVSEKLTTLAT